MKNFGQLMKQAQEMQSKIQDMQSRLADIEVTGQSGAGLVTVIMNARNEVRRVGIDPSLFNAEDVSVVEDLIVAAFSDAKGKAESKAAEEMQKIAGRPQPAAGPQSSVLRRTGRADAMPVSEIDRLIQLLARLPGLGPRSARRAALHLIKRRTGLLEPLAQALAAAADSIRQCGVCSNVDTVDPCAICADERRDERIICVVEDVADLWALERTAAFNGRYHVLGGTLSALDGRGPDETQH